MQPETESATLTICGDLIVTAPTDSTVWIADGAADKTISWDIYGKVDNVRIDYTRGGTGSWITIVPTTGAEAGDGAANKGLYDWTIPTTPSSGDYITRYDTDAKGSQVRIFDQDANYETWVQDTSSGFIVKGQLVITVPSAGTLSSGLSSAALQPITWQRSGRINAVNVKYSTDGGSTYPNVIQADRTFADNTTTTQSTSSSWSVPETPINTTYKLLIEDTEYEKDVTTGTYVESANFRVKGEIALTAPTSTDIWSITEQKNISWKIKHGNLNAVKIIASPLGTFLGDEYDVVTGLDPFGTDGFSAGLLPDRVGSGTYQWTIPVTTSLVDTIKFKVVQDDASFTDIISGASAAMDIRGTIVVQTPTVDFDAGLDWKVGETSRQVKFTPYGTGLSTVYIYLYDGSSEYQIDGGSGVATAGDGNLQTVTGITVPDVKSHSCVIRVRDTAIRANSDVEGVSNTFSAYPTITGVTITPSVGDEASNPPIWRAGLSNQTVTWTENDIATPALIGAVEIWYSPTGDVGVDGVRLADNVTTHESSLTITAPTALSYDQAVIRVRDDDVNFENDVYADSALFRVLGRIIYGASPASGDDWFVGEATKTVTWTAFGNEMTSVDIYIDYDGDGGVNPTYVKTEATVPGSSDSWIYDDPDVGVDGVGDNVTESVIIIIEDADASRKTLTKYSSPTFNITGKFETITAVAAVNPAENT